MGGGLPLVLLEHFGNRFDGVSLNLQGIEWDEVDGMFCAPEDGIEDVDEHQDTFQIFQVLTESFEMFWTNVDFELTLPAEEIGIRVLVVCLKVWEWDLILYSSDLMSSYESVLPSHIS